MIEKSLRYRESTSAQLWNTILPWRGIIFIIAIDGWIFRGIRSIHLRTWIFSGSARSFVRPPLHPPPLISCRTFPPIRICDSQRIRGFVIRDENKPRDIHRRFSLFFCASNSGVLSYLMYLLCDLIWIFTDILNLLLSMFVVLRIFKFLRAKSVNKLDLWLLYSIK